MTKWHWDEAVQAVNRAIEIVDDGNYTHVAVIVRYPEELRALIERLEKLAEELGWNND